MNDTDLKELAERVAKAVETHGTMQSTFSKACRTNDGTKMLELRTYRGNKRSVTVWHFATDTTFMLVCFEDSPGVWAGNTNAADFVGDSDIEHAANVFESVMQDVIAE